MCSDRGGHAVTLLRVIKKIFDHLIEKYVLPCQFFNEVCNPAFVVWTEILQTDKAFSPVRLSEHLGKQILQKFY